MESVSMSDHLGLELEVKRQCDRANAAEDALLRVLQIFAHPVIPENKEAMYADLQQQKWKAAGYDGLLAKFKNFHRSLCERFGAVHDDADWQRDLCSLEEHIASKLNGSI